MGGTIIARTQSGSAYVLTLELGGVRWVRVPARGRVHLASERLDFPSSHAWFPANGCSWAFSAPRPSPRSPSCRPPAEPDAPSRSSSPRSTQAHLHPHSVRDLHGPKPIATRYRAPRAERILLHGHGRAGASRWRASLA